MCVTYIKKKNGKESTFWVYCKNFLKMFICDHLVNVTLLLLDIGPSHTFLLIELVLKVASFSSAHILANQSRCWCHGLAFLHNIALWPKGALSYWLFCLCLQLKLITLFVIIRLLNCLSFLYSSIFFAHCRVKNRSCLNYCCFSIFQI